MEIQRKPAVKKTGAKQTKPKANVKPKRGSAAAVIAALEELIDNPIKFAR